MKTIEERSITAIRILAADAIQKANSGHPGMVIGSAPMGYALWKQMKHNPKCPTWQGRDRFVLSAGHASMLEYALLHLFGYDLTMDDIKNFRQLGSRTPGHPEFRVTAGVEASSGCQEDKADGSLRVGSKVKKYPFLGYGSESRSVRTGGMVAIASNAHLVLFFTKCNVGCFA